MDFIKIIPYLLFFAFFSACGQQVSGNGQSGYSTYGNYNGQQLPGQNNTTIGPGDGYVDENNGSDNAQTPVVGDAHISGPRAGNQEIEDEIGSDDDDDREEEDESADDEGDEEEEEAEEPGDPNEDIEFSNEWHDWEMEVLRLTNVVRARGANCGGTQMPPVGPVEPHDILRKAAYLHSKDMADNNYFNHNSQDGRTPFQRIRDAGWTGSQMQGENIAAGQRSPQQAVDGWEASPGHCRNMMRESFNYLGVGYSPGGSYGHYWTQNFSQ